VKVKRSLEFSASSFFQEKDEGLRQEKISIKMENTLMKGKLESLI